MAGTLGLLISSGIMVIAIAIAIGNTEAHSQQCMATTLGIMLLCIIILITTLKLLIFNPSDEMKVADTDIVDSCLLATAKDGGIIVIIICLFLAPDKSSAALHFPVSHYSYVDPT